MVKAFYRIEGTTSVHDAATGAPVEAAPTYSNLARMPHVLECGLRFCQLSMAVNAGRATVRCSAVAYEDHEAAVAQELVCAETHKRVVTSEQANKHLILEA